jgi:hypothetical protein
MERRTLGNSGLETVPLMLDGNVFGWTADRTASFAMLAKAMEISVRRGWARYSVAEPHYNLLKRCVASNGGA